MGVVGNRGFRRSYSKAMKVISYLAAITIVEIGCS